MHQHRRGGQSGDQDMRFTTEDVRRVSLDGVLTYKARCPLCGTWGYIDDDQFHGRVSMECGEKGCTFHETHDLSAVVYPTGNQGCP